MGCAQVHDDGDEEDLEEFEVAEAVSLYAQLTDEEVDVARASLPPPRYENKLAKRGSRVQVRRVPSAHDHRSSWRSLHVSNFSLEGVGSLRAEGSRPFRSFALESPKCGPCVA